MVVSSLAEVLSIGSIFPLLSVLIDPNRVAFHPLVASLIRKFGIDSTDSLVLTFASAFSVMAVLAGAMRLLFLWTSTRVTFQIGAELSGRMFERTLYQPYAIQMRRNSSEVISGVTIKANELIYAGLLPSINLVSSVIIIFAILVTLLTIDAVTAMIILGGFGLIYWFIILMTRRRLFANSHRTASAAGYLIRVLQEGLGGIRDILLDGTQRTFINLYRKTDEGLRKSQGSSHFLGAAPRFAIEAVGMIVIAFVAYGLSTQPVGGSAAIPVLGALAMGIQRMLPTVQQAYAAWAALQGGRGSVLDALCLLEQPIQHTSQDAGFQELIHFNQSVELRDVSLAYGSGEKLALDGVSLTILKGERVGFVGATGSGKSSLMDVLMGLMPPTYGGLYVDEQLVSLVNISNWQALVAHVPQSIFLADMSVAENIAFGVPRQLIDMQRVREAASQAQISELIESWPQKYDTYVGERGVRMSGGQRQRVGIARALYKQADVVIFDEATSALDDDTERAVIAAINGLSRKITILMVAHRISTLRECDRIVKMEDGKIASEMTYAQLMSSSVVIAKRTANTC